MYVSDIFDVKCRLTGAKEFFFPQNRWTYIWSVFMWRWFYTCHRSSDLKCPLSGAITLMLCDVLNNVQTALHLNLPDSMNERESDVKTELQASRFSLFSFSSSLSRVFHGIRTQGFTSSWLSYQTSLLRPESENTWSCKKTITVLPPLVLISSLETAVICTYWVCIWHISYIFLFASWDQSSFGMF